MVIDNKAEGVETTDLTRVEETAIQQRYVDALIKRNPGLGERSQTIAEDLVYTGLKPFEALALINMVYSPKDALGRGQGTRLKHFADAIQQKYGERLESIRGNPALFKGFLTMVGDLVEMRDAVNEYLSPERVSLTFKDAIEFEEAGLTADSVSSLYETLVQEKRMSPAKAIFEMRRALKRVREDNQVGNLESLLDFRGMDELVIPCMGGDDEYLPGQEEH